MAAAAPEAAGAALPPLPPEPMPRNRIIFRNRPEGKIACLALCDITLPRDIARQHLKGEIAGITFQKVDTGHVKALLPTDSFSRVTWEDAPTKAPAMIPQVHPTAQQRPTLHLNNQIQLGQANHISPQWQEFTNIMGHVKNAILTRMTPQNGVQPQYLLNGFKSDVWISAPDPMHSLHMVGSKMRYWEIVEDIDPHLGNNQLNRVIRDWVRVLVGGLYNGILEFKSLFEYLFPDCLYFGHRREQTLSLAPAESSTNGAIGDGVMHCLNYGFHRNQSRPRASRLRERFDPNAPVSHRMLHRKELGGRSRSRSPVSDDGDDGDDGELPSDCIDPDHPNIVPDYDELFDNPDRYFVKPNKLYKYFESHKPDLLLTESKETQDPDFPGTTKEEVQVKISFQMASHKKFVSENLTNAVLYNTEQCVQSCLSGFGCDQELMYGIVIVVDGLKLVKIERQQNQNGEREYIVSDTDLILWDQADLMHAMFELIEQIV